MGDKYHDTYTLHRVTITFFKKRFINFKIRISEREMLRQREKSLSSTGSLPMSLQWLRLGQTKDRSWGTEDPYSSMVCMQGAKDLGLFPGTSVSGVFEI